MLLLGGWLTNRGFAALKAYAEGDTEQLNSIALEVGKTLAIVGGIFLALNVGILGIVGTIGKMLLLLLWHHLSLYSIELEIFSKEDNKAPQNQMHLM